MNELFKFIKKNLKFVLRMIFSKSKTIACSKGNSFVLQSFTTHKYEVVCFPEIFNISKKNKKNIEFENIKLIEFENSTIYSNSDIIELDDFIIWDKFYGNYWNRLIPLDHIFIYNSKNKIWIDRIKKIKKSDLALSLCGVQSDIWSHFLVQFLPKLLILDEILKKTNRVPDIIIPDYLDHNILEIIDKISSNYKNLKFVKLKRDEKLVCKKLLYLNNFSHLTEHSNSSKYDDVIISDLSLNLLTTKFFNYFNFDKNYDSHERIFIERKGVRNISNYKEVKSFLLKHNFKLVNTEKLTINEKINVFSNAKIITGPASSGFSNIIFCKPKTKVVPMINNKRVNDPYFSTIAEHLSLELIHFKGEDIDDNFINSDYKIDLKQYSFLINEYIKN